MGPTCVTEWSGRRPPYALVVIVLSGMLLLLGAGAARAQAPVKYEAEGMERVAGTGKIFRDSNASALRASLQKTRSTLSKGVSIPAIDRIVVRARGDHCKGAPAMVLKIDGRLYGSWSVRSRGWVDYSTASKKVSGGEHVVSIQYVNEYKRSARCDRNLRLDSVSFVPQAGTEPSQGHADKPTCQMSLQGLVDKAASGSVVTAPGGCVYREKVVVNKPLVLEAAAGAEIRGSDVWTEWERHGEYWTGGRVPSFSTGPDVRCKAGTSRCLWPEQVFFDGMPLTQVASRPTSNQFAVDADRNVVLADDPEGHTVEVTTRTQWISGGADNVTIKGFTMRHAASARELGAITNRHDGANYFHSGWTIEANTLSDAHTAVVVIKNRSNKVLRNDISRGGQLGIHGSGEGILIQGNKIYDNNTEGFDPFWEAGGIKMAYRVNDLTVDDNEVYGNDGPGVWCDIDCTNVVYSGNRVHHNARSGLFFEISSGAKIFNNAVWENGWGVAPGPWNPGISIEGSDNVEVYGNVVSWNAGGISVIHMRRQEARWNDVENVNVHDNNIFVGSGASLSWIQQDDWSGGMMGSETANNRGAYNRYWYPSAENSSDRFRWVATRIGKLSSFNSTPGEENGEYVTKSEMDLLLSSKGMPLAPESR